MDSCGRLSDHDGARARPGDELDQVGIAVQKASGGVEQVKQCGRRAIESERRQDT
jgi:hypothetical protein